jgi:hypothetical protein
MTTFIFANNINTALAGNVSTSDATITLASTANLPPSIPAGSVLVVTLNDAATRQNYEVCYASAITVSGSNATLTVARGQEGTAALAWLTGDFAFSPPTAGQQRSFGQTAGNNSWSGTNTFTGETLVPNANNSGDALNLGQAEGLFALINGSTSEIFNASPGVSGNEVVNFSQFPFTSTPTGSVTLPNGFTQKWGHTTITGSGTVAFNSPFANSPSSVSISVNSSSPLFATWGNLNNAAFSAFVWEPSGVAHGTPVDVYWMAVGS